MADANTNALASIKPIAMLVFFLLVNIFGNIPLRSSVFQKIINRQKVLSYASAFTGGLFLSVGLLHLLPEAVISYNESFDDEEEHFPLPYVLMIASFTLILFIERVMFKHDHSTEDNQVVPDQVVPTYSNIEPTPDVKLNDLTPYVLQIALGIHAIFEGLAIGIQNDWLICLGISLAVCFHKWAEGLSLGIAFKKAKTDVNKSSIQIFLQGFMNPLGIAIGWGISDSGSLVSSIFISISVGTFVYISCIEIITHEFENRKNIYTKFILFFIANVFVMCFWFLEQATDHEH